MRKIFDKLFEEFLYRLASKAAQLAYVIHRGFP